MSLALDIHHQQGDFILVAKFEAEPGVLALFGASGSGKTTLANILAGLVRPARARIMLAGELLTDTAAGICLPPYRRRIGYVFQEGRLFPHLSVRQNLIFGRWFAGKFAVPDGRVDEVMALLALAPLLERAPNTLSGGEKQRVAIGRALLSNPRLLIMDEPLASLDQPRKDEILPYLERLRDQSQVPMVYISHSLPEVARLGTVLAVLEAGRLKAFGPVSEILQHADLLPASERGQAGAVIDALVDSAVPPLGLTLLRSAGNLWQVPALAVAAGTRLRLRVRARDVMIALSAPDGISALNSLPGRIVQVRAAGSGGSEVLLDCGGDQLVAQVTTVSAERLGLAPGQQVHAVIKAVAFDLN